MHVCVRACAAAAAMAAPLNVRVYVLLLSLRLL